MTRDLETTRRSTVRRSLAAVCMSFAATAFAQSPGSPPALESEARLAAHLEQAPHEQIQAVYVACSNEAEQRLLGFGEAAMCSLVYETLKRRVFGGDFDALLAWSRAQRSAQAAQQPKLPVPAAYGR